MNRRPTARKTAGLAALALLIAAAAPAGAPLAQVGDWREIKKPPMRPFAIPEPERYVMKNGLVVMLMEDHELPLVEAQVRVRTGSRLEPAEKAGLASMTGQVLRTGGAGGRTGDEIDDYLDARGARIETSIGLESGSATLSCLKTDFPDVIKVFADVLRAPAFEEAKIKVARTQAKAAVARRNDDPMQIMFREGQRLAYGADSPYARTPEYATLDAITQADLKAFHGKYFIPNRTILGVVGDFDPKEMKALLDRVFGTWPRGPKFEDPEPAYRKTPAPGLFRIVKTDMTQSDVIMGHLGIRQDNPDYFAASVMNEVLSGSFASRLFSNVRSKKGLAYSVRGGLDANYDYPGAFTLWLTTKTETTAAAIDALLEEVDALRTQPFTEEEVRRAKESILSSFVFNFDSRSKILNRQITYEHFGYPRDFLSRYRENVEKVAPADVTRVARTYVKKEDLAVLVVGKTEGVDRPLETFGKVAAIDITIPEPAGIPAAVASAPGVGDKEAAAKGAAILKKVLEAFGGAAKVDSVKSTKVVVQTTMTTPRGEMTVKATQWQVYPDRVRQEMSTPAGPMTVVVTPKDAFVDTPMGIQQLPESRRTDLLKQVQRDPFVLLQHRAEPGFSVRYEGTDAVESVLADVIAVSAGGEVVRFAVDPPTGRILRAAFKGTGPAGVPGDRVAIYSDFRTVDGVTLPFKARQLFNGEPMGSVEIQEAAINVSVEEEQFARPAAPASAQPAGGR